MQLNDTTWIQTSYKVFTSIYNLHESELSVFMSITNLSDDRFVCEIMTEWGFKKSEQPLIKSHFRHGEWKYYIRGVVTYEE